MITANELRKLLRYDPETGKIYWAEDRHTGKGRCIAKAGDEAGYNNALGYLYLSVNNVKFVGHRVAWALYTGKWPEHEIDHVNCDPSDNRISNLREATRRENLRNMRKPSHNTSGFKGVCFDKSRGKWLAYIKVDGNRKQLGRYPTKELAHEAYKAAAEKLHGEFARTD